MHLGKLVQGSCPLALPLNKCFRHAYYFFK